MAAEEQYCSQRTSSAVGLKEKKKKKVCIGYRIYRLVSLLSYFFSTI